jgi:hypothetical protein
MPINYQVLGLLINKQRPYGTQADTRLTVDLTDPTVYREKLPEDVTAPGNPTCVDVFGPLVANDAVNPYPVQVETTMGGARRIAPIEEAINLTFPNGSTYDITKGLRIPYTYKTETGEDVDANVFVLFNGSGQLRPSRPPGS